MFKGLSVGQASHHDYVLVLKFFFSVMIKWNSITNPWCEI